MQGGGIVEKYNVFKLNNSVYNFLVVANIYENPINIFLSEETFKFRCGTIIFDLTLIYGCKSNRYIVAQVNNGKLDISSIKPIANIEESIKRISQEHFLTHSYLVENSILPNATKYRILHSMC